MAVAPQIDEAIVLVLGSLVSALVENGALKPEQLKTAQVAFEMQSETTLIEQKRANTAEAGLIMAILAGVAGSKGEITVPHLRLVQSDEEDGDAG